MTLAEAGEVFRYWEQNPPAHLILQTIARMLGWVPSHLVNPPADDQFADALPPGLAVVRGHDLGMPAPLGVEELRARNRARAWAIARRNQGEGAQ
jgi:hypothetical protein